MPPTEMSTMSVADVMERWPATIGIFNSRRMACPGCVMAPFMTVADAAASYDLDASELIAALADVVTEKQPEAVLDPRGRR